MVLLVLDCIYFYFMDIGVLPACIYIPHALMACRVHKRMLGPLGLWVILWELGWKLGFLEKQALLFTTKASFRYQRCSPLDKWDLVGKMMPLESLTSSLCLSLPSSSSSVTANGLAVLLNSEISLQLQQWITSLSFPPKLNAWSACSWSSLSHIA